MQRSLYCAVPRKGMGGLPQFCNPSRKPKTSILCFDQPSLKEDNLDLRTKKKKDQRNKSMAKSKTTLLTTHFVFISLTSTSSSFPCQHKYRDVGNISGMLYVSIIVTLQQN